MSFTRKILTWGISCHADCCTQMKAFKGSAKHRSHRHERSSKRRMSAKSSSTSLYWKIMNAVDPLVPAKLRPLWEHEAGPKTIFFWAPLMKGSLVVASLKDLTRTPDTISPRQSASLAFTGILWSRWSLVIIPKNYLMFAVNFFVFLTQAVQTARALMHNQTSS